MFNLNDKAFVISNGRDASITLEPFCDADRDEIVEFFDKVIVNKTSKLILDGGTQSAKILKYNDNILTIEIDSYIGTIVWNISFKLTNIDRDELIHVVKTFNELKIFEDDDTTDGDEI